MCERKYPQTYFCEQGSSSHTHTHQQSVCVCVCSRSKSVLKRAIQLASIYISPHQPHPNLPAPHLLGIFRKRRRTATPTLSPNHHSVCVCVFSPQNALDLKLRSCPTLLLLLQTQVSTREDVEQELIFLF